MIDITIIENGKDIPELSGEFVGMYARNGTSYFLIKPMGSNLFGIFLSEWFYQQFLFMQVRPGDQIAVISNHEGCLLGVTRKSRR